MLRCSIAKPANRFDEWRANEKQRGESLSSTARNKEALIVSADSLFKETSNGNVDLEYISNETLTTASEVTNFFSVKMTDVDQEQR